MKEIIVHPTPELRSEMHDVPVPSPGADQVVIKVIVAGSNVKGRKVYYQPFPSITFWHLVDWLHLTSLKISLNSGDDIAGIIHDLGSNVKKTNEFHIGDRVAAFHPMMTPHGAFAEFAIAPQHTVFKIPEGTTFEGELLILYLMIITDLQRRSSNGTTSGYNCRNFSIP